VESTSQQTLHQKTQAPLVKPTTHLNASVGIPGTIVKSELTLDNSSLKNEGHQVPQFVSADWTTRFLPTLYHVLFCAEKPFHNFVKGSHLLNIVQQVLDVVHPNHSYVLTVESKLYHNVPTPLFSFTVLTDQMLLL
jgi:hypothetical protein